MDLLLPGSFDGALRSLMEGLRRGDFVRTVNFHATPARRASEYDRQMALFARFFAPVRAADLDAFVDDGVWSSERPGLLPLVFEARRDNHDVLAPILERHGFIGWFFPTSEWSSIAKDRQRSYAVEHRILLAEDERQDARVAMSWDQMRSLRDRGHVFGCHTRSHQWVDAQTPDTVLEEEITLAKSELEAELGLEIPYFVWRRGAEIGVSPRADAVLRRAGFRYLFSNFKIQRLR